MRVTGGERERERRGERKRNRGEEGNTQQGTPPPLQKSDEVSLPPSPTPGEIIIKKKKKRSY